MRRRRRRDDENFGLSFLDVISGGFGAMVLLLVLVKSAEPTLVKQQGTGLEGLATQLADRLPKLEQQMTSLQKQLAAQNRQLAQARQQVAKLQPQASAKQAQRADQKLDAKAQAAIVKQLASAKQTLTAEMRRLQKAGYRSSNDLVGGIPVDSEYIIFVIDTSGSMHGYAWSKVAQKMRQVLDAYPHVKGMQVMSDMGDYMFPTYAGEWIPDTSGRRKIILQRLASWQPFSNSSPVEGIERAIRTYDTRHKRISIYVFGDEFTGNSIQSVLDTVRRINPRGPGGEPRVRIHGIGFPTQFTGGGVRSTGVRFATLMRTLCYQNGGTFVGLRNLR